MSRFLFIIGCVLAVLVAVPLLIVVGGIFRSIMIVAWTFYDALAEEEALYPVGVASQPVRKLFAFDGGWRIIGYVVQQVPMRIHASAVNWIDACDTVQYVVWSRLWFAPFVGWLPIIGLQIAARIQYVIAFLLTFLFLVIHALLLTGWAICLLLCLGLVALLRLGGRILFYYFAPCPHCYKSVEMPIHVCPTCQARHPRLQPGIYGITAHRCRACRSLLPTLDVLGRKRLERLCPSCLHPISSAIGSGASIHIALVGATAAGKTSYLVQAIGALSKKYRVWHHMNFPDKEQREHFQHEVRQVQAGRALSTSMQLTPVPYVLHMQPSRLSASKLVYFYDPIGKVFTASEYGERQEYYRYTHGILLCIDGSTLPGPVEQSRAQSEAQSGELQVVQTYERMMQMLEIFVGLGRRYTQPVAVVVTKIDQIHGTDELGGEARMALMQKDASLVSEAEATHRLTRAFLSTHGLDNVVRDLESHFEHVRYFSCAALEEVSDGKDGTVRAMSVLDALEWLLVRARAIPR